MRVEISSVPKIACNVHHTLHAGAVSLYVEMGGTLCQAFFDPNFQENYGNDFEAATKREAVANHMNIEYVSPATKGDQLYIDSRIIKYSKGGIQTEIKIWKPKTKKTVCTATYKKSYVSNTHPSIRDHNTAKM